LPGRHDPLRRLDQQHRAAHGVEQGGEVALGPLARDRQGVLDAGEQVPAVGALLGARRHVLAELRARAPERLPDGVARGERPRQRGEPGAGGPVVLAEVHPHVLDDERADEVGAGGRERQAVQPAHRVPADDAGAQGLQHLRGVGRHPRDGPRSARGRATVAAGVQPDDAAVRGEVPGERRPGARPAHEAVQAVGEALLQLRPVAGENRYFVLTHWADEESFQAWLNGPAKEAHAGERARPVASGSALLEFEVVQRSVASS
jgi:hypothetical protein